MKTRDQQLLELIYLIVSAKNNNWENRTLVDSYKNPNEVPRKLYRYETSAREEAEYALRSITLAWKGFPGWSFEVALDRLKYSVIYESKTNIPIDQQDINYQHCVNYLTNFLEGECQ